MIRLEKIVDVLTNVLDLLGVVLLQVHELSEFALIDEDLVAKEAIGRILLSDGELFSARDSL